MLKILVTGSNGLLGSKIVKSAEGKFVIIPTVSNNTLFPNFVKMDITKNNEVSETLNRFMPDVVINTAAETNVDKCETEKEHAWNVNVVGAKNIAETCKNIGARLIHISTDYVFDGEKGLYTEEDATNPVSYYGLTKLEGEKAVKSICKNHVIIRTSVLYGWHDKKQNFVTWVINSLTENKKIHVADDHFNSPTLADNLAEAILEVAENNISGTIHISGSTRINRFDFAEEIARTFDLDNSLINRVKMKDIRQWIAKRPKDSSLCIDNADKTLKTKMLDIYESLKCLKCHAPICIAD